MRFTLSCALIVACLVGCEGAEPERSSGAMRERTHKKSMPADQVTAESAPSSGAERRPCGLDTGWRGDDQCILAPEPSEGFQLHFGPANYDNPEEIARYTLAPGAEALLCTYIVTPNDAEIYYLDWQNKLRPGSHHMIVSQVSEGEELAGVPCGMGGEASGQGLVAGNTTTVMPLRDVAPENEGLARTLPAHVRVSMQLHYFNATEEPLLMEAWQNIYYADAEKVKGVSSPIESYAGLGMMVQPGTTEVIRGTLMAPQPLRVLELYSHHHDHTRRFSIFLKRAGSEERTQIYEPYDWEHPLLLPLDSVHKNATLDTEHRIAGGMTGMLEIEEGDALEFECEIENDDLDIPLRFANEAHTAEMCIMRGFYAPSMNKAWSSYSR